MPINDPILPGQEMVRMTCPGCGGKFDSFETEECECPLCEVVFTIGTPEKDPWRTLQQKLPKFVYDEFLVQMCRVSENNGGVPGDFMADDKNREVMGSRVAAFEALIRLIKNTPDEGLDARK